MLSFTSSLGAEIESFVIFINENHEYKDNTNSIPKSISQKINSFLRVLKSKRKNELISSIDITDKQKCFIFKIKKNYKSYYPQESGGEFFSHLKKYESIKDVVFLIDTADLNKEKSSEFFSEFIFGFNLKSYTFNKYITSNKTNINKKINLKIITKNKNNIEKNYKYFNAIQEGVFLTRDLVSEPPNVLTPKVYTQEIKKLSKLGLEIKIYNEKK